jgi:hypothetical protein
LQHYSLEFQPVRVYLGDIGSSRRRREAFVEVHHMRSLALAAQHAAQRLGVACSRTRFLTVLVSLSAACSYADESGARAAIVAEGALPPSAAGAAAPMIPGVATNTDAVAAEPLDVAPTLLSQTGLYSATSTRTLAPNVQVFSPTFPLWSDAAGKLRWVSLPEGAQIDTSDMDMWKLPVGTKLWKEFEKQGHVIETRYMAKFGPSESDWLFIAYHWNAEQTDATAVPDGVVDANGSTHDIPSTVTCKECHNSQPMAALGFSALQLSNAGPGLTLDALAASGRLTTPPTGPLTIPGDPTSIQALGYLHGNCGGCHNDRAPHNFGVPETKVVFWQSAGQLGSLEQTTTYINLVTNTQGDLTRLQHGLTRMKQRDPFVQMPPLGTEVVDTEGVALIEAWLSQLQGRLAAQP